ncbi:D-threonine aldolase [Novipirellula galeiformis]|uniref:D-threonine aldolase n=1 Tax=Novipirellula galeiformis TaxID=2528004 RepID=A0A5C6BIJ6_9BACT|nr:D-TA family PLP-dependent enzyme [Novipirellula galeiformis]TWU11156.1 D-threonine aldolase [Novipirellula galeiformis]
MSAWYEVSNINDVPSPSVLVYPDRIDFNLQMMIDQAGDVRKLRPHVKTHKLPQVVRMKLSHGITKFKTSTIAEAEMVAIEGGPDVMLAYQPVGPNVPRLIKLIQTYPQTRFAALVDCVDCLDVIAAAAVAANISVPLFVDLNVGMDRSGIVPGDEAFDLFMRIASLDGVEAAGLHAYDGHVHDSDPNALEAKIQAAFAPVWRLKESIENAGMSAGTMVVSGTPTSFSMAHRHDVEVGAGTSVLWDTGQPKISPDLNFQNAAVLISRVISHPTPNRICVDLGHKAVASEFDHPRVTFLGLDNASAVMHSEEHLVLEVDDAQAYPVGTVLYGLPRHVCPTMALHQQAWCVREGRAVETWPITARARCLTI